MRRSTSAMIRAAWRAIRVGLARRQLHRAARRYASSDWATNRDGRELDEAAVRFGKASRGDLRPSVHNGIEMTKVCHAEIGTARRLLRRLANEYTLDPAAMGVHLDSAAVWVSRCVVATSED